MLLILLLQVSNFKLRYLLLLTRTWIHIFNLNLMARLDIVCMSTLIFWLEFWLVFLLIFMLLSHHDIGLVLHLLLNFLALHHLLLVHVKLADDLRRLSELCVRALTPKSLEVVFINLDLGCCCKRHIRWQGHLSPLRHVKLRSATKIALVFLTKITVAISAPASESS